MLAGLGVFPLDEGLRSMLTMPALMLGAFGPTIGACVAVRTLDGRAAPLVVLRRFLSLRFGWRAWLAMYLVLGAVNAVASYVPELFGGERVPMLLEPPWV